MAKRKYTLPRHTNLASQGTRIGAFLIDLAIFVALILGFYYFVFSYIFLSKTEPLKNKIFEERIKTHLFFEKEGGGLDYYSTGSDNNEFKDAICYFYTTYIPYVDERASERMKLEDGTLVEKKDYFTVEWFNKEVLEVEGNGKAYFEYQKDGENDKKDVIAVIKADADASAVNSYLQQAWAVANLDLNSLESFSELNNKFGFWTSLAFVLSSFVAGILTYIVIPLIIKNGATAGKKLFGLCLADSDGYKMHNSQLILRIVPLFLVISTVLIPIWISVTPIFIMFAVMFLISFAFSMASPKRSSLHDLLARTIVVNARTSILFTNALDEEAYIAKEDGIVIEENGDEPTISYEK